MPKVAFVDVDNYFVSIKVKSYLIIHYKMVDTQVKAPISHMNEMNILTLKCHQRIKTQPVD